MAEIGIIIILLLLTVFAAVQIIKIYFCIATLVKTAAANISGIISRKSAAAPQEKAGDQLQPAEIMALPLAARLACLHFASYQEMYENAREYLTDAEVEQLSEAGELDTGAKPGSRYTQDDIVEINGRYCDNEQSEDWEDFEYQFEEDHHDRI